MCTVVVRWAPRRWSRILALRDELTSRPFDDPGYWWPDSADVIGGRDRLAGGTWGATRVSTAATALVLNRPQKRLATDGAPSRGILPLLAATHGADWTSYVDVVGMASFALVLVTPDRLTVWDFDGENLTCADLDAGTHMVTSGRIEDGKVDRYLGAFQGADFPDGWRALVQDTPPQDDLTALVVRHDRRGATYATVFGQLIDAQPGRLQLEYSRTPWEGGAWTAVSAGEGAGRGPE